MGHYKHVLLLRHHEYLAYEQQVLIRVAESLSNIDILHMDKSLVRIKEDEYCSIRIEFMAQRDCLLASLKLMSADKKQVCWFW